MKLTDPVTGLKGIGEKMGQHLARLEIYTVGDLLHHYPRLYQSYGAPVSPACTDYDGRERAAYEVTIRGQVLMGGKGGRSIITTTVGEAGCDLTVIWFHSPYLKSVLKRGTRLILYGLVTLKGKKRTLEHPEIFTPQDYQAKLGTLWPVYPLTEGITQNFLCKYIRMALADIPEIPDPLSLMPAPGTDLPSYDRAIRDIHFPAEERDQRRARARLAYDEFLEYILAMRLMKSGGERKANPFAFKGRARVENFKDHLPFRLTPSQTKVWEEIAVDLEGPHIMNRLVQGDVGSGKTIIAAMAMYYAALSGYQSCLMAPTEVLARQHFEKLSAMFGPLGIPVVLMTGSQTAAARRQAQREILNSPSAMIIGTQALFQDKAEYLDIALIVTDEQHRFGVRQRERLADKGSRAPHVLVMSATPIPRTLAIVLYSDLDVSQITEKPADRRPIKNCVVGTAWRPNAYRFILDQVRARHQVYVICPMVEESEGIEAENVQDYTALLKAQLPADVRILTLHGRMKPAEKEQIMTAFSRGEADILVSTTVVEVGVDVPNATVIMIENAERFGLAQLHQLRGRVGRGSDQSYCILVAGNDRPATKARLDIMQKSNDGFWIAAQDLKLRGPGDMLGVRQSGEFAFGIADIYADHQMLTLASEQAAALLKEDPLLEKGDHPILKERLLQKYQLMADQIIL